MCKEQKTPSLSHRAHMHKINSRLKEVRAGKAVKIGQLKNE